jgi:hypothetical protein
MKKQFEIIVEIAEFDHQVVDELFIQEHYKVIKKIF